MQHEPSHEEIIVVHIKIPCRCVLEKITDAAHIFDPVDIPVSYEDMIRTGWRGILTGTSLMKRDIDRIAAELAVGGNSRPLVGPVAKAG